MSDDVQQSIVKFPQQSPLLEQAVATYVAGMSPNTQRAYASRLNAFLEWRDAQQPASFVTHLKQYVAYLREDQNLSPRSVQAHINTIKGMLRTAAALEPSLAPGLPQLDLVKAPQVRGEVQGRRLTAQQARLLLNAPGKDTIKGIRDSAILGLLLTLGLRRSEVCTLTWEHITEIDGHKVIANLKGKHGRIRTLKLPVWLWRLLNDWGKGAGLDMADLTHHVFVPITKDGRVLTRRAGLTPHAIYKLINAYTAMTALPPVKPHDLRRTAALLARRGGATIEQVQLMLGHASPQTTSNYIGETLDLDDNAVDYSPLRI
ncbi:MAG: site-specific integrase [Anaerolineae bacterium]|nr:site-specific integrase [Anaerolineae bacterium]